MCALVVALAGLRPRGAVALGARFDVGVVNNDAWFLPDHVLANRLKVTAPGRFLGQLVVVALSTPASKHTLVAHGLCLSRLSEIELPIVFHFENLNGPAEKLPSFFVC
jgi:hypothetical protein